MTREDLDLLVEQMPAIAGAVNLFNSEGVQKVALEALLRSAFQGSVLPSAGVLESAASADGTAVPKLTDSPAKPTVVVRRRQRTGAKKDIPIVRDLNFRPTGHVPFREFCEKKAPSTHLERNLVAVYYLEQEMGVGKISASHVIAAFKEAGWKPPANPVNSLSVTASKHGWLDTTSLSEIKTTHSGRATVDHDLPRSDVAKKRK